MDNAFLFLMQKIWRVRPGGTTYILQHYGTIVYTVEPLKGDAWLHKNGTWFELSWPTTSYYYK